MPRLRDQGRVTSITRKVIRDLSCEHLLWRTLLWSSQSVFICHCGPCILRLGVHARRVMRRLSQRWRGNPAVTQAVPEVNDAREAGGDMNPGTVRSSG